MRVARRGGCSAGAPGSWQYSSRAHCGAVHHAVERYDILRYGTSVQHMREPATVQHYSSGVQCMKTTTSEGRGGCSAGGRGGWL